MTRSRVTLSEAAVSDILDQSDWYRVQSGLKLARRWEQAVSNAIVRISRNPRIGANCSFKAAELRDVRRTTIQKFPKHLLFYHVQDDQIVVLRVIHGARDLESLF